MWTRQNNFSNPFYRNPTSQQVQRRRESMTFYQDFGAITNILWIPSSTDLHSSEYHLTFDFVRIVPVCAIKM